MAKTKITVDEWLAELESCGVLTGDDSPDGFTSQDFASMRDIGLGAAKSQVRRLRELGRVECAGRRRATRETDGVAYWAPVYRPVRKEK